MGHDLWLMTRKIRLRTVAETCFLHRVSGLTLRERENSPVIHEKLGLELLPLCVEKSQSDLIWMPPGHLPLEVFQAQTTGQDPNTLEGLHISADLGIII